VPSFSVDCRSDADLLVAHVAGDRRAFAELFGRHRAQLYRLARRRSQTAEDADDALQEAMLSAHRAAGAFRHDAAVGSWLHRIVLNACSDRLRRKGFHTAVLTDDCCSPTDQISHAETEIVVRQALSRLPAGQRAAVVAIDMYGYSVTDTATLLGIAEGTVKSRCARARARLAVQLSHLSPAGHS
jgi:RNA polymerase sigma-70 factor (ECF subfamily)